MIIKYIKLFFTARNFCPVKYPYKKLSQKNEHAHYFKRTYLEVNNFLFYSGSGGASPTAPIYNNFGTPHRRMRFQLAICLSHFMPSPTSKIVFSFSPKFVV